MKGFQAVLAIGVLLACQPVAADSLHVALNVECDKANDAFILSYVAGYNEAGERMIEELKPEDVDPGSLLTYDDIEVSIGNRTTIRTVVREVRKTERRCELSDGIHEVRIGPAPSSLDAEGRCGLHISMSAEIRRGSGWSEPIYFHEDCHNTTDVIIGIQMKAGQSEPDIVTLPSAEYWRRVMADAMLSRQAG